jgi:hypothetical protein
MITLPPDPRARPLDWPGRLLAALALGLVAWRAWVEFGS